MNENEYRRAVKWAMAMQMARDACIVVAISFTLFVAVRYGPTFLFHMVVN